MTKSYSLIRRFRVHPDDVTRFLSKCKDVGGSNLVEGVTLYTYRLAGIPRNRLQIAAEQPLGIDEAIICEIGLIDGEKEKITFRHREYFGRASVPDGIIRCTRDVDEGDDDKGRWWIFASLDNGESFVRTYDSLRTKIGSEGQEQILMWHWRRFYAIPVPEADALALSAEFVLQIQADGIDDLNDANRLASRMLYRLARDLGWRKLSPREQKKLGIEYPWIRPERVNNPSGCGDYTIESASGNQSNIE